MLGGPDTNFTKKKTAVPQWQLEQRARFPPLRPTPLVDLWASPAAIAAMAGQLQPIWHWNDIEMTWNLRYLRWFMTWFMTWSKFILNDLKISEVLKWWCCKNMHINIIHSSNHEQTMIKSASLPADLSPTWLSSRPTNSRRSSCSAKHLEIWQTKQHLQKDCKLL